MLRHREYHHIVNSSVGSFIRKQGEIKRARVEEKIDGANFCLVTDGKEVKVGRRNVFLKDDEIFFNFQALQHGLDRGIQFVKRTCLDVYPKLLPEDAPGPIHLYIYGELVPTQKRIKYTQTEKVHFVVFDVLLVLANHPLDGSESFHARELWEEVI